MKISKSHHELLLYIVTMILYIPFIFSGYGDGYDHFAVVESGKQLFEGHGYTPSRYPGFFLHESLTGIMILIAGNYGPLFLPIIMSLAMLFAVMRICDYFEVPGAKWIGAILVVHPVYLVASTMVTDFVIALGFNWLGLLSLINDQYVTAGILWGLAIGSRMTSFVFMVICLLVFGYYRLKKLRGIWLSFGLACSVGMLFVVPPFIYVGYSFEPFLYFLFDWNSWQYIARFIYKNLYFWSIPGCLVLFWGIILCYHAPVLLRKQKPLAIICIVTVIAYEVLFLKLPWQENFLLPILPCVLLLFGMKTAARNNLFFLLLTSLLLYNVVNFNIAKPDMPNNAKSAMVGLWIEKGYTWANYLKRVEVQAIYQSMTFHQFEEYFYPTDK